MHVRFVHEECGCLGRREVVSSLELEVQATVSHMTDTAWDPGQPGVCKETLPQKINNRKKANKQANK